MREIQWYFPKTLDEVKGLLKKEGTIPHGGGTSILRGNTNKIKGLIDLSRLPLHYFRTSQGTIEIGATLTFAEVCENIMKVDSRCILAKALKLSASTPLRNRITVGGSIALFPAWSDLMGPLLSLDAELSLIGGKEGVYPITEYVGKPELRKSTLITGIRFKHHKWDFSYYRETRTHFDYPAFTVTILMKKDRGTVRDIRAVIVGCTGKYRRLTAIEQSLEGREIGKITPTGISDQLELKFTGKKFLSPEYLKHLAGVQIERGLLNLLEN